MGMLKVTISGDYRTSGGVHGDVVDFENVVGIMPECSEDWIQSHVMNRFIGQWLKADSRYPARFNSRRTCYIDKVEKVAGNASCIGKDIKSLNWDELQELAVIKNLFQIPLIHATDLRAARETAYLQYSEKVLGKKINMAKKDYSYVDLPALLVKHNDGKAEVESKLSNEDVLNDAQSEGEFTKDELIKLATEKGLDVDGRWGYKKLHDAVFSK